MFLFEIDQHLYVVCFRGIVICYCCVDIIRYVKLLLVTTL